MKKNLYIVGGVIAAVLIAFGAGYGYRSVDASAEAEHLQTAMDGYEKQLATVSQSRAASDRRYDVRTAQLKLREAEVDIAEQNFGLAASHVQQAGAALSQINEPDAALQGAIDETKAILTAVQASDEGARAKLDALVGALDRYLSSDS